MSHTTSSPYRLPTSVIPSHYDLTLEPDLEKASFTGSVRIRVDIREPLAEIVLNAKELELGEATLVPPDGDPIGVTRVSVDPELERAAFVLERRAEPGPYTLEVAFQGVLNDKLAGFYRSTFTDEQGRKHTVATTQLESTDARRAFPCFDEPAFKAAFAVTLVIPDDLFAVSNAPIFSEEAAGRGRKRVRFADTMKMSTYLVAFVVGPFEATEPTDVDGVPLRIIHPPGKGHLTAYALEAGAFALRFFRDYYGIPYPGQKLDMVAIPDFAYGAMENLGCITYREVLLLVDEARATQSELMRVADVIAHEIAHMWFGDLVTMRWWNGIWLNEAFATFMATLCSDAFNPDWGRWEQFSRGRSAAFDLDSLVKTRSIEYPVESPADAHGMFDLLTYQKGASVLRMLEQYLGQTRFRDGIRRYLREHAYGNTETGDLWDAIEEVTGEPVRRIMDSWIFQPGFPLITVSSAGDGSLDIAQQRFFYATPEDGDRTRWFVPLVMRFESGEGAASRRDLLDTGATRVELGVRPGWVLANAGSHGFYRVQYTTELRQKLADGMMINLAPAERYTLVDDAWASVLAGMTPAVEFLGFAERFAPETDLDVWAALAGCLASLDRLLEGESLRRYRERLRALFTPAAERLGWAPREGDSARTLELRALVIRSLAVGAKDESALAQSRALHDAYLSDPSSVEPNIASAVAAAVASEGSAAEFEQFLRRFKNAETPQEETRYRSLLATFPGRAEIGRTLEMTLSGEVRTQDAPYLLGACLGNRDHGSAAWEFVKNNWERMLREYPDSAIVRMLGGVRALARPEVAADVFRFFETHEVPTGRLAMEQHLEKLRINVALREREAARFERDVGKF